MYDKLDPIGKYREDLHISYLSSIITNIAMCFTGKKGTQKFTTAADFPFIWNQERKERKKQSLADMKKALFAMAGKKLE